MDTTSLTSLALALGIGLLIGVERERRKGQGPTRQFAGVRSFAVMIVARPIGPAPTTATVSPGSTLPFSTPTS